MPVTDRLMSWGQWSLKLKPSTPKSFLANIALNTKAFSHVFITGTHFDAGSIDPIDLLNKARFTGVYRRQSENLLTLSGPGVAWWLEPDLFQTAPTGTKTFVQWMTALKPAQLSAGTYAPIGVGTMAQTSGEWLFLSPRQCIDLVCNYFGGEWRVNPNFTLDAGAQADLYTSTTTPTVVAIAKGGGRDTSITGLRALEMDQAADLESYATKILVVGNDPSGATEVFASTGYKDPQGNAVVIKVLLRDSGIDLGNETAAGTTELTARMTTRREISLSTDAYDIEGVLKPGDTIGIFDPDNRLFALANPVQYRGQLIYPTNRRVMGVQWPIEDGYGVYFRDTTSGSVVIRDLTEYVQWEKPPTRFEIGANPRPSRD